MNNTLDNMIDGSMTNLNIGDSLDLVPYKDRAASLERVCKKIMYGGFIEISGCDFGDLIRASYQHYVQIPEYNEMVYGDRQSISSLENMVELLINNGFNIINQRRNKYIYYIKAERNNPSD